MSGNVRQMRQRDQFKEPPCSVSQVRRPQLQTMLFPVRRLPPQAPLCRTLVVTAKGRKALDGCDGRWPEPCRDAWPVSRFAWCEPCKSSSGGGQ